MLCSKSTSVCFPRKLRKKSLVSLLTRFYFLLSCFGIRRFKSGQALRALAFQVCTTNKYIYINCAHFGKSVNFELDFHEN